MQDAGIDTTRHEHRVDGRQYLVHASGRSTEGAATVVLVHGIGMTHASLEAVQRRLPPTLRSLNVDLAGFGSTERPRRALSIERYAADLAHLLRRDREESRKLSRAGIETLAIIAYHEPVTRAEIEAIRGVQISKGTIDVLMEAGWVRPAGRREVPGRPLTYATTPGFLSHFGLANRRDLPGIDDLKAAGLLDPVDLALGQLDPDGEVETLADHD